MRRCADGLGRRKVSRARDQSVPVRALQHWSRVSHRTSAQAVLADWRAVERKLDDLDPQTPEADELKLESYRLRTAYQRIVDEEVMHHRPGSSLPNPNVESFRIDYRHSDPNSFRAGLD